MPLTRATGAGGRSSASPAKGRQERTAADLDAARVAAARSQAAIARTLGIGTTTVQVALTTTADGAPVGAR